MKIDFNAETLWLIPVGIAIWFMLWVLWSWWREEHRYPASLTGRQNSYRRSADRGSHGQVFVRGVADRLY